MGYRGTRALPCGHRGGEAGLALPEYLSERVFAGASVATLEPTAGVAGYERFLDAYRASLPGVEVIARGR